MADRKPEIVQIKASAGSGKTYTLTRYYLDRLKDFSGAITRPHGFSRFPPQSRACLANEILAITFTNAAAAEMRARIIRRLKEDALDLSAPSDRIFASGDAREWLNAILRDMSALNIRTIDSLLHLIARSSALDLGLNPDYEPVFETRDVLAPRQEYFLQKCLDEGKEYLPRLKKVFGVILDHASSTGFHAGERLNRPLEKILSDTLAGNFDNLAPEAELEREISKIRARLGASALTLFNLMDQIGVDQDNNKTKSLRKFLEPPANWPSEIPAGAQKDSVRELCKKNSKEKTTPELEAAYQEFAESVRRNYGDARALNDGLLYYPLIQLAKDMEEEFFREKPEEYKLPNVKITGLAQKALDYDSGVADALCRLGTSLQSFLIDEFQDTSADQWRVLRDLVQEALANGGSMTFVGDVKQSIYGFRNGDPGLFDSILKDPELTSITGAPQCRQLDINWRSNEVIVEHTNNLFAPLNDPVFAGEILKALLGNDIPPPILEDGVNRLVSTYSRIHQNVHLSGSGGYVACDYIDGAKSEDISGNVVARLVELIRDEIAPRRPWSDILILARANWQASLVAEGLLAEHIPVVTENSLLLAANPLIIQTLALLRFINDPKDNLSFWSVAAGSLYSGHPAVSCLSPEDLHKLRLLSGDDADCRLFAARYPELWQKTFDLFLNHPLLRTPYDLTREWFRLMDAENRFPEDKTFLRRFLEILHRAEALGFDTIPAFLKYWMDQGENEKAPMPESIDAARIMTIHKAKGLEAPVVIFPWANMAIKAPDKPMRLEVGGRAIAARPTRKATPKAWHEYMIKQSIEALNMFYVAVTRPREELYILYNKPSGYADKFLGKALDLMFAKLPEYGEGLPYRIGQQPPPDENRKKTEKTESGESCKTPASFQPQEPKFEPMDWIPRLKIFRSPSMESEMKAGERGSFIHFCLERMRPSGNPAADAEKAFTYAMENCGVHIPENEDARASVISGLEWFAGLEKSAFWLESGIQEQRMTDENGRVFRADLIVPLPAGLCVIDYKSGEPEETHRTQVLNYLRLIEKTGEYGGKHFGLLIYLDQKKFLLVEKDKRHAPTPVCPI